MTTHYEVLRSVEQADLNTQPNVIEVLKSIPPDGYVTFEWFKRFRKGRVSRGLAHACSRGILRRVSPYERVMMLDSVKFWCTQLNDPGHKNTAANHSTKQLYLRGIFRFDEWLQGRSFPSYKTVWSDGQTDRESITKSFGSVEEMMQYCEKSNYGTKTAQRAIREFMANLQANKTSAGVMAIIRSSIKSYFRVHDIVLNLPKPKKNRDKPNGDNSYMSLEDFYKMLQYGNPGIMMKTVILIKFQSGMDSSTLVDRFNYEGYPQIVKHFKTDDHKLWDIDRCPVPIRLVRVKTNVQYLTFIDRNAVTQLKEYLTWKEAKHGKQDITKPLFLTKQGNPITCTR